MKLQTINQVSKDYGITPRMLRYYEKIGLIQSLRKEDYAYRVYDETALRRLQQIVILRKLRVSMKQIGVILSQPRAAEAIEIFKQNISELGDEINALSVIRNILIRLAAELQEQAHVELEIDTLMDSPVMSIVNSLSFPKNHIKESTEMDDLKQASEKLNKLTDRDVRIVYLPPCAVASAHHIGDGCEGVVYGQIAAFINKYNLHERKPDFRAFGFNNPMAGLEGAPSAGYEAWVTIPDDMDVPAPLVKKQFTGGLYAAHMIPMGAFEEWGWLRQWVMSNEKFVHAWGEVRVTPHDPKMDWAMEEPLNFYNIVREWDNGADTQQLDLLFPIKPKFAASIKHPQERIVDTFKYNGMSVEVVEWDETIWCGKIGYADNNTDEPDMGGISDGFLTQDSTAITGRLEPAANTLLHFGFQTSERPAAAMFAFLVGTENQPEGFDVKKVLSGKYMRLDLAPESAKALGVEPWQEGRPPIEWISERLAPQFSYKQVFDLPFIEYYGYLNGSTDGKDVVNAFLYVPVEKIW